ncbi:ABC transporter ATP-binding protein [Clostridium intestinale]|uniref:ABC transporter ATP-binding protein n=1 Tax=Clostridium intestinale TaxID=36845 RepID=UPI002DD6542A|nr:ABC transporter ATP-binding protein [Clostridium intestinale]WRY51348.1 ABC transporter ATP-binding protein [Clostridium intestinale]
MPKIILNHINKVYPGTDGTKALEDINLTIEEGEFVAILGPSGCGKSTLLEIIAGLLKQSSGDVFLGNEKLDGPSKDIGVVFQDSSLFPWRTIRKNIEFGLEIGKIHKEKRKSVVDKYIDIVNLRGFEDKYPHQLSGGMKQRAGLARTMVNNPEVLLMDEPLGAVDYLTRLSLQDEIVDLWKREKKTIIFITHDVSEAVYLGTRVVLLSPRPGRIRRIFEVPFSRPRNRNDENILEIIDEIHKEINSINAPKLEEKLEYIL